MRDIQLYMIDHLFTRSGFSKNDFLHPLESTEFKALRNVHGDEVLMFKLQIDLTDDQYKFFVLLEELIKTTLLADKHKEDDVYISTNLDP